MDTYIHTYTYILQKEWSEEGGVYSGPASDEQPARRRRGDSVWSLGVEEIRPETHQGLALPKVQCPHYFFFSFKICVWQTSTPFPIIKTYRHRTSLSLALLTSHGFLFRKRSAAFMLQHRCRDHVNQINVPIHWYTLLLYVQVYMC